MKIPNVTIQQLLEAGVHLGHKTLRWNPKMKKYIFGKRDSIHIIDLTQTLELNRQILNEGSSLILTLVKSISDSENRFKRTNVQKIVSLKDLLNKPIDQVTFNLKSLKELDEISKFLPRDGDTLIKIKVSDKNNNFIFQLKNKRNIDRKTINILRNREISAIIA